MSHPLKKDDFLFLGSNSKDLSPFSWAGAISLEPAKLSGFLCEQITKNMLPKKAIEQFKKLYKNRFGVDLSDEEASRRANNLVNLYKAVYSEPAVGQLKNRGKETE